MCFCLGSFFCSGHLVRRGSSERNRGYPLAFGGTYPSGNLEPSPKKNCSICSSMIFCELGSSGFNRYSFMTILECSSHSFHASFETLSYTRLPISPRQGMRSKPGKSLSNFTHCILHVPGCDGFLTPAAPY